MILFEDYAARFARGERPDLREYLGRAGPKADKLAQLVDAFLMRAEPPAPDEETIALTEAWLTGQPPLVELRTRRGLRRAQVVDALIDRFRLDPAKRQKVARYYHEIETGQRTPADESLLTALAEILRTRVGDLISWRPLPSPASAAYFRASAAEPAAPPTPAREEPDEIDRLFAPRR
jgi:hypothetical protein